MSPKITVQLLPLKMRESTRKCRGNTHAWIKANPLVLQSFEFPKKTEQVPIPILKRPIKGGRAIHTTSRIHSYAASTPTMAIFYSSHHAADFLIFQTSGKILEPMISQGLWYRCTWSSAFYLLAATLATGLLPLMLLTPHIVVCFAISHVPSLQVNLTVFNHNSYAFWISRT